MENDIEEKKEEFERFTRKREKKGVWYMQYVPPYMNPASFRRLLSAYNVERIYMSPEPESARKQR